MVHSCGDGFSIVSTAVSYDIRYARIRVSVFLGGSVVLVVMDVRNVSGVVILRRFV